MEIDLDNINNNLRRLSRPDYYYLQPQSEKYKAKHGMRCSYKNNSIMIFLIMSMLTIMIHVVPCVRCTFTIFDYTAGEIVCSTCGMVINDYMESLEPEWRNFSDGDSGNKQES